MFPAIVGLWFAALFGLGSLAIRTSLIEGLVIKLHIDLILPAAAPPLGIKAHVLIALAMSIGGGMLGLVIARWIARPKAVVQERRRGHIPVPPANSAAQTPAIAREAHANRRKSLAISEDHAPDYARELAPLPGGSPHILDVTQCDIASDGLIAAAPAEPGTLDLSGFLSDESNTHAVLPDSSSAESVNSAHIKAAPVPTPTGRLFDKYAAQMLLDQAHRTDGAPHDPPRPFAPPSAFVTEYCAEPLVEDAYLPAEPLAEVPAPVALEAAEGPAPTAPREDGPLDELSSLQLIERLARSLQKGRQRPMAALPAQFYAAVGATPPAPVEAAAPELPQPLSPAPAQVIAMPRFDAAEASRPTEAQARIVPPPIAMPAALLPVAIDFPEDDVLDLDCPLPPRRFSLTAHAEAVEDTAPQAEEPAAGPPVSMDEADESPLEVHASEDEGEDVASDYSSLLAINNPPQPRQGYIRIDEPEVESAAIEPLVVFPGQAARAFAAPSRATEMDVPADLAGLALRRFDAPPAAMAPGMSLAAQGQSVDDREEAARALRTALATLQRMSGAA